MIFPETQKNNQRVIKLQKLSRKLHVSNQVIIKILHSAGFVLPKNNPNIFLSPAQIEVIASNYIDSIKKFHKKFASAYQDIPQEKSYIIVRFFSHFIDCTRKTSIEEIANIQLDETLIKNFFYTIIFSVQQDPKESRLNFIFRKLKFRFFNNYSGNKKILPLIGISNHYHIFPKEDDEEHIRLANSTFRFSFVFTIFREASINTIIYLKLRTWKIYNYSSKI